MTGFNLIDEPWIPCIDDTGTPVRLSVRKTLQRATVLQEISHSSPLVTISVHRFLLALLHRTHGPSDDRTWEKFWSTKSWDWKALDKYLQEWHPRFELLEGAHRIYQSTYAEDAKVSSISKIAMERASGDNATLFDHTPTEQPMPPGEAGCYLLATQAFAVGGLVTPKPRVASSRSARDSHLVRGAVALLRGRNLFETLLLNLSNYNLSTDQPYRMDARDRPAWEVEQGDPVKRIPLGWLDLLTWQSRRILLHTSGSFVTGVALLKGDETPEDWHPRNAELMVAYLKRPKATQAQDPYPPIGITEGRSLWRDSRSLFVSVDGGQPIGMLRSLASRRGALGAHGLVPVDLMGVSKYQAKLLLWRHERVVLPTTLLSSDRSGSSSGLERLRIALDSAESAAGTLGQSTWRIANIMATASGGVIPSTEQIRAVRATLYQEGQYWHRLDGPFTMFMSCMSGDDAQADRALEEWRAEVRASAISTFEEIIRSLNSSVRVLRACSSEAPRFYSCLNKGVGVNS
jgi:CRISPR system Cascade subunit CasA